MSLASDSTRPAILAQNMDPPIFLHGFPTLLHIKDSITGIESYVYTFPGFIGLCGMNANIAITCNGISMLKSQKSGIPVAFVVRSILECKNEEEAFLKIQKMVRVRNIVNFVSVTS